MMYELIVFLPLIAFLIAGIFGRWIGARGAEYVTTGALGICFVLSWIAFFQVVGGADAHVQIANWFTSGKLAVNWALRIDTLTAVMLVVVTTVSFLVHLYSVGYMHEDPARPRFFAYLSLFTFAMLMLVTADNLVQMFFGWEGVGLASYLLIGFWYDRPSANAAAIKAFVVNRVGDFGFALGIFLTFRLTGSVTFDRVFAAAPGLAGQTVPFIGFEWDAATIVCLLLFMGAMGKSAQFLLHTWLPDAMEGPTPVSALIHAATMVTAGVFMVARLSPLFEMSSTALSVVTIVGGTTALFAATVGLVQNDIKRVIAYSTCSQLGYMFVGLGVGGYSLGMFHLFTHAFFKALLFLGAGSVIHAMHHEQDMRRMGGLRTEIPFTFWAMIIGTLALTGVGIPFTHIGFAGYVSKDPIIEAAFASHRYGAGYAFCCVDFAAGLTAFYSWRLIFMTFFGHRGDWGASLAPADDAHGAHAHGAADAHDDHAADHAAHESPLVMLIPLAGLALGAVFAGMAFHHEFIGEGFAHFWRGALAVGPDNHILEEMEHVPALISLSPTLMMLGGLAVAYYMYIVNRAVPKQLADAFPPLYQFLLNKWYFDELYDLIFVRPAFWIGRLLWKGGDGAIIDGFGPDGVSARVLDVTRGAVRLQSGYIYQYAFAMLLGVAALATWYLFGGSALMSGSWILSGLLALPLIGALFILLLPGESEATKRNARWIALFATVITFVLSLVAWGRFNTADPGFQLIEEHDWFSHVILYKLGVDGISMPFVLLTTFLMPFCIAASWTSIQNRVKAYMVCFLVLETLMIGVFVALDIVLFYLFFEGGLIPMFLIIGIWGGKNRVYAAFKFFLYTLTGSLLMLLAIMAMYWVAGTTDITVLLKTAFAPKMQTWLWLAFFASFAVKMPMWPVHTWLPDAHVEAPTAGSVILAGIMLKMGGYGFIRFSLPMFPDASVYFAPLVYALSVIAIIYTSLVALVQEDMKKLIAYSSVAHMGFVTMGLFAANAQGVEGAVYQMISHGLVSGALFLCVGVVYDRMHTREIAAYGGLVQRMPLYAVAFLLFTLANVGLPGTSGFLGEFLTLLGTFQTNTWVAFFASFGLILSAPYALYLYRRVIFGVIDKPNLMSIADLNPREIAMLLPLGLLVLYYGVHPQPIIDASSASIEALLKGFDQAISVTKTAGL